MANVPTPISDAQARAMEASANTVREAVQTLRGLGGYLERVFGTVPEDLVGYFGGDRLKVARAENIVRIMNRSKKINDSREVEPESISVSLALPLLVAAADESRDELVELWARLLAAAADPNRVGKFRQRFIDVVKQFDPTDAIALQEIAGWRDQPATIQERMRIPERIAATLSLSSDEFEVSRLHLASLGLLVSTPEIYDLRTTSFGREFLRAVND